MTNLMTSTQFLLLLKKKQKAERKALWGSQRYIASGLARVIVVWVEEKETWNWKKSKMHRKTQLVTLCLFAGTAAALTLAAPKQTIFQKILLKAGRGKRLREQVVESYFDGVDKQNLEQIVNCFDPAGTKIRDVCGVSNVERMATPEQLGERCMEFLAAHPDCRVMFHYP
jgi:hypothetical protein